MEQFEKDLAFFCAPALAGIKPSNLLSCSLADYPELSRIADEYNQALAGAKIRFTILCSARAGSFCWYTEGTAWNGSFRSLPYPPC